MTLAQESKPGYLTTEFWLVVLANALTQLGAIDVPERYEWLVLVLTLIGYALSRGLAKLGEPSSKVVPADAAAIPADEVNAPTTTVALGTATPTSEP